MDVPVYGNTAITPAPPPPPAVPPRPLGDLSTATIIEIGDITAAQFSTDVGRHMKRCMRVLLHALSEFPGTTWQQRWDKAGLNELGTPVTTLAPDESKRSLINTAADFAFCMRLIHPSLEAFKATKHFRYSDRFRKVAADPLLEKFSDQALHAAASADRRQSAIFDVCAALTVFGIDLADLTPQALLHYINESSRYRIAHNPSSGRGFVGGLAWAVLYDIGVFPATAPRSLAAARTRGQQTVEQLVDRFVAAQQCDS
jgi:hypothetical protein